MTSSMTPNNLMGNLAQGGNPKITDEQWLANLITNSKDQQTLLNSYKEHQRHLKGRQLSAASVLYPKSSNNEVVYLKYDETSGKMIPRLAKNHLEDYRKTVLDLFTKEGLKALNGNKELNANQQEIYNNLMTGYTTDADSHVKGIKDANSVEDITNIIDYFCEKIKDEGITIPTVILPENLKKTGVSLEEMAKTNDSYKGKLFPHKIEPDIFAPSLQSAEVLMEHSQQTQILEKAAETQLIQHLKNDPDLTVKLSAAIETYKKEIKDLKTDQKDYVDKRNQAFEKLSNSFTAMFDNPIMFGLKLILAIAFPIPFVILFLPDVLKIGTAGINVMKNTEASQIQGEINQIEKNIEKLAFLLDEVKTSQAQNQNNQNNQNQNTTNNPATTLAAITGNPAAGSTTTSTGTGPDFQKVVSGSGTPSLTSGSETPSLTRRTSYKK